MFKGNCKQGSGVCACLGHCVFFCAGGRDECAKKYAVSESVQPSATKREVPYDVRWSRSHCVLRRRSVECAPSEPRQPPTGSTLWPRPGVPEMRTCQSRVQPQTRTDLGQQRHPVRASGGSDALQARPCQPVLLCTTRGTASSPPWPWYQLSDQATTHGQERSCPHRAFASMRPKTEPSQTPVSHQFVPLLLKKSTSCPKSALSTSS